MKHAANRSRSTVKPRAKSIIEVKALTKTKPETKKPNSKIVSNSRRPTPVQKAKLAVAKPAPKASPRVAKPTIKKTAATLSAKTSSELKAIFAGKVNSARKQSEKSEAKKVAPKVSAEKIKTAVPKTKPVSSAKKAAAKTIVKKPAAAQKAKFKVTAAMKTKVSAGNLPEKTKLQSSKVAVRAAKSQLPKAETTVSAKVKSTQKTKKPVVAAKKPKSVGETKLIRAAEPIKRKKLAVVASTKKANQKSKQIKPIVSAEKVVRKTKKVKPLAAIKKVVTRTQRLKPAISAAPVKNQNRKNKKIASVEKIDTVRNVIEAIVPLLQKPKNRKARPISSAVFRGKKERYDFKVFALNEKFEPIPAVYIISKRKTDRHKRGHHALICIGETASISDELKRHRKGKCVKKHEANVVSILPETDEKIRLQIETDLKAAHAVVCNLD